MSERQAVALAYEPGGAPRVVAKGEGDIADRILALAEDAGVPVERNPELAAALSAVELDDEIPIELFRAVAIVIGQVLRARKP